MATTSLCARALLRPRLAPASSLSRQHRLLSSTASKVHPGLYYHPHPSVPHAYTLSYLESPPPSLAFSPTTIGTLRPLPASSSSSSSFAPPAPEHDDNLPPITPRTFQENPDWLRLVHDVLREHVESDPWLETRAKALHDDTHLCVPPSPVHLSPTHARP